MTKIKGKAAIEGSLKFDFKLGETNANPRVFQIHLILLGFKPCQFNGFNRKSVRYRLFFETRVKLYKAPFSKFICVELNFVYISPILNILQALPPLIQLLKRLFIVFLFLLIY